MAPTYAVAWIDHHTAQVLQIDAGQILDQKHPLHAPER